ncbi:hypothetical protein [Paenibacillus dauci]|uniref:hypothetical protein n=1 Tax=Paenibacillus dauci TaxID=1567106 RepID=UPI0006194FCB|nr:hypothetical protein [Paenibacillus dauci]
MQYPLRYIEWSEDKQLELGRIHEYPSMNSDELFVHKLVDAIKLNHRIWVHISHESEDTGQHIVYARPFAEELPYPYQKSLARIITGQKDYPSSLQPEYWVWNGDSFERISGYDYSMAALDIARRLLDHYWVENGVTYDMLYTVLDADRQKVMFFLSEVRYG